MGFKQGFLEEMISKLSPVDKWDLESQICGRKTAFERQLLKSPGGKRTLSTLRDLQVVYAVEMKREGCARITLGEF